MLSKFYNEAKLKTGVWLRERREKAEAKKALHTVARSEHGHGRFFLLHIPATATICAAVVEWYWALLFCIEATGRVDWNYETSFGTGAQTTALWNFAFSAHWPVLVGLVAATIPIVMLSMVWLPVQFSMRGAGRWRRGTVIVCGILANILVIVSGTVVMNYNRQEQVREAVVVEQTAAQGRAAIDARLAFEQEQLRLALNNSNPYLNQAANVGAAEWERSYVAQARATNDPRLPMLERALGAARAADQRRANIEALTVQRATAAPEAASAANIEDNVGRELNTFAQYVEVWRPPFVALICTLIGIFGAWWVLALMQGLNPRDVLRSGWADENHRIEDLREQEPVVAEPPVSSKKRRRVYNAETGREEVFVQPKGYWRGTGKKQKNADGTEGELTEFVPEAPPDETGVEYDGGERAGVSVVSPQEPIAAAADGQETDKSQRQEQNNEGDHLEPPISDEDAVAALVELEFPPVDPAVEQPNDGEKNDNAADPDSNSEHQDTSERKEPETDPAKLIAAE